MKKLILCEKPSVAGDFLNALKGQKKNGYYESDNYYITWGFGHLLEVDDRGIEREWKWDTLPIFPESFRYKPKDAQSAKQLNTIKDLLKRSEAVIIATDPGREGELIARLILQYCGWKNWGSTYRFWTSEALTPQVILKNLKLLKPAKEYDSLYWCAQSRAYADWYVGINLTRGYSLKVGEKTGRKEVWSIGRVQTPSLYMIYRRAKERKEFKPEEYAVVYGDFARGMKGYLTTKIGADFGEGEEEDDTHYRLKKEEATQIVKQTQGEKHGTVDSVIMKEKAERPPLLHSLTSLQREANSLYKYPASKTLQLAQSLYEAKYISYPRTDAQYLATSSRGLVIEIMKALGRADLIESVENNRFIFNDSKLTDHYALIVMKKWDGKLSEEHKKIYDLIMRRFIGVFYPDFKYNAFTIVIDVKGYKFRVSGRKIIEQGWKALYGGAKGEFSTSLKKGDTVSIDRIGYEIRHTEPPPLYTEGLLLKVMEKMNLGTPATRASIIDTLKHRTYVSATGKLEATPKGEVLAETLKETPLVSPELTEQWETKLENIYKKNMGYSGYKYFIDDIKGFVQENLTKIKHLTIDYVPTPKYNKKR